MSGGATSDGGGGSENKERDGMVVNSCENGGEVKSYNISKS